MQSAPREPSALDTSGATILSFGDGDALSNVVGAQTLEGIVPKRLDDPYVPGDRRPWVSKR
jgi:ATP-dependent DNA ligase